MFPFDYTHNSIHCKQKSISCLILMKLRKSIYRWKSPILMVAESKNGTVPWLYLSRDQSTVAIRKTFGKFDDVLESGCHCLPCHCHSAIAALCLSTTAAIRCSL